MQAALVDAIVRGERAPWLLFGVLATLALVFATIVGGRDSRPGAAMVFARFGLASLIAAFSLPLGLALSIPRIEWKPSSEPSLVVPSGESWRRLRGPAVQILLGGEPELAIPTIDAADRWVLFGLLSGDALPGLPPADATLPEPGAARLCGTDGERCRAWPAAWPPPAASALISDFSWEDDPTLEALAFDVESGLYLRGALGLDAQGYAFDLAARGTTGGPREGASALVVARRIASDRLSAARILSMTTEGEAPKYFLERAHVSLTAAPRAYAIVARPLLVLVALSLPLAIVLFLFAPALLRLRLRRLSAVKRELSHALVVEPVGDGPASLGLATVADDAELGGAVLPRGSLVSLGRTDSDGAPIASRVWFEIPSASTDPTDDSGPRSVGVLVPADRDPFRAAARAWILPVFQALSILALGVSIAAPAIVGLVSVALGR